MVEEEEDRDEEENNDEVAAATAAAALTTLIVPRTLYCEMCGSAEADVFCAACNMHLCLVDEIDEQGVRRQVALGLPHSRELGLLGPHCASIQLEK